MFVGLLILFIYGSLSSFPIHALATDPDTIWFPDQTNHQILFINKETGAVGDTIGTQLTPISIRVGDNYIWTSDQDSQAITAAHKTLLSPMNKFYSSAPPIGPDDQNLWIISNTKEVEKLSKSDLSVLDTLSLDDTISYITSDGTYLWGIDTSTNSLYRIDPSLGSTQVIFKFDGDATRIIVDQTHVFIFAISNFGNFDQKSIIYTINKKTSVLTEVYQQNGTIVDFTLDEAFIWIADYTNQRLVKIQRSDYQMVDTISTPTVIYDISVDDQYLWLCDLIDTNTAHVSDDQIWRIDRITEDIQKFSMPTGAAILASDITGNEYDLLFNTLNNSGLSIKGNFQKNNPIDHLIDQDISTYAKPKKNKSKIILKYDDEKNISKIKLFIQLLGSDSAKIKINLKYKQNGTWITATSKTQTYSKNQWILLNDEITTQKLKITLKNKKINGVRGAFALSEYIAYESD